MVFVDIFTDIEKGLVCFEHFRSLSTNYKRAYVDLFALMNSDYVKKEFEHY